MAGIIRSPRVAQTKVSAARSITGNEIFRVCGNPYAHSRLTGTTWISKACSLRQTTSFERSLAYVKFNRR